MNNYDETLMEKKRFNFKTWKELFKLVPRIKRLFFGLFIAMLISTIVQTALPFFTAKVVTIFFRDKNFSLLLLYTLLFFVALFINAIGEYFFIIFGSRIQQRSGHALRKASFNKLQKLPYSYYDRMAAGWIIARMSSDTAKMSVTIGWQFIDLFGYLLWIVAATIIMFIISWKIALTFILVVPVMALVIILLKKVVFKAFQIVRRENSKTTGFYNEAIIGIATTKSLVLEKNQIDNFQKQIDFLKSASILARVKSALMWPLLVVLGNVASVLVFYVGGNQVLGGTLDLAQLTVTMNLITRTVMSISSFAELYAEIQQAQAAADRVSGLLNEKVEIKDTKEVIEKYGTLFDQKKENWEAVLGDVTFKNISFGYNEEEKVLDNFSLEVKKGEMIALVGATGGGKTTIVNLLCRFYEPKSGSILIDGTDYKKRSLSWLRQNVGYVLQNPHLFNGSIKENIRFGKLNATDDEIEKAAVDSQVMEISKKFPEGLMYNVGENGSKLSLGERQLVSFARVLVKNPAIIILDEATASVDTETELRIKEVTKTLLKGKTSFVVAHRLSTIVEADKIVVVDNGKIVEMGTHTELLQKRGRYFKLCVNEFTTPMKA